MSLYFDASKGFLESISDIDILINLAEAERSQDQENKRILFIKLSVILLVTKFQVFIEDILEEFQEQINGVPISFNKIPIYLKLNSLKLKVTKYALHENLKHRQKYDPGYALEIKREVEVLSAHFRDTPTNKELEITCKFSLGKTGANELKKLFYQIDDVDIFNVCNVDINTFNSLFSIRNLVVHQDDPPGITEHTIKEYRDYLVHFSENIDDYLSSKLTDVMS